MYDLDNVSDYFAFKINKQEYRMTFPTMEEIEKLQKLAGSDSDSDQDKVKSAKKIQEYILSFISPVNPDAEPIELVVKRMNIAVYKKFNDMIQKEFGSQ